MQIYFSGSCTDLLWTPERSLNFTIRIDSRKSGDMSRGQKDRQRLGNGYPATRLIGRPRPDKEYKLSHQPRGPSIATSPPELCGCRLTSHSVSDRYAPRRREGSWMIAYASMNSTYFHYLPGLYVPRTIITCVPMYPCHYQRKRMHCPWHSSAIRTEIPQPAWRHGRPDQPHDAWVDEGGLLAHQFREACSGG